MTNLATSHRLALVAMFLGSSFFLHLVWENTQMWLYAGFENAPLREHFWICFKAAWGDLFFMLLIYAALAIVHRDSFWIADRTAFAHPATWIITALIGILLAVSFELWAVYVHDRWQYARSMPVIPVLQIGLAPVLQMLLIPLAALFLLSRFSHSS